MSMVIKLIGTAAGVPTVHDGRYLSAYVPAPLLDDETWGDGVLETVADSQFALKFPNLEAAMKVRNAQNGLRPDGEPNRPLTAWTLEFEEDFI